MKSNINENVVPFRTFAVNPSLPLYINTKLTLIRITYPTLPHQTTMSEKKGAKIFKTVRK
jgi:hypothetical protein